MSGRLAGLLICVLLTAEAVGMLAAPADIYAQEEYTDENEIASIETGGDGDEAVPVMTESGDSSFVGDIVPDTGIEDNDVFRDIEDEIMIMPEEETEMADPDVIDPDDYVYPEQTSYHITFRVLKDGMINEFVAANTLGFESDIAGAVNSATINQAFLAAKPYHIAGWRVGRNGHYDKREIEADFSLDGASFMLKPRTDYTLTAILEGAVADGLYVRAVPDVYYESRNHVAESTPGFTGGITVNKKTINDIDLKVVDNYGVELRNGTDYKVVYKNNQNASMRMKDDGTYERLDIPDSKRPMIKITGLNNFAGYSATVYFDILPYNLGEKSYSSVNGNYSAWMTGINTSYTLKSNGTLNGTVNPKVSIFNGWSNMTTVLKKDKDYVLRFYRYNEAGKWILKDRVDEKGRWLCTARGIGNYCGTVYGQYIDLIDTAFNEGSQGSILSPAVCDYKGSSVANGQFMVDNGDKDLSKAKVSMSKTSFKYVHGKEYTAQNDFKIRVTLGGSTLVEGTDYIVIFDGEDYYCPDYETSSGAISMRINEALYDSSVWMANKYRVWIEAVDGNPSGYYGMLDTKKSVTISGVKIMSKWFVLSSKGIPYNGKPTDPGSFKMNMYAPISNATLNLNSLLSGYITNSSGTKIYDYDGGIRHIFDTSYMNTKNYDYGVLVLKAEAIIPGTYNETVFPFGPGVDHSTSTQVGFKRTPISLKEALNNGIIQVSVSPNATYNAGATLPETVTVYFNGKNNTINMPYNNFSTYVFDKYGYGTYMTFTVVSNPRSGTTKLKITATDNKIPSFCVGFKGSAETGAFNVNPATVNASHIHVLDENDYEIVYGHKTNTVRVNSTYPVGSIYAAYTPAALDGNGGISGTPKIDLYQSYYEDSLGYSQGRAALKKLSADQFMVLAGSGDGSFNIHVSNAAAGPNKTGFDFGGTIKLDRNYDCYMESVTITSVTVVYDGQEYTLPADSKKLVTQYRGSRVEFDSIKSVKIKTKTGEKELGPAYINAVYGDNVAAGKNKGQVTIILKKGPEGYLYGGSKTFKFTIQPKADVVL